MNDKKNCSKCEMNSSISNFCKDITKKGAYRTECKFCTDQYHHKIRKEKKFT